MTIEIPSKPVAFALVLGLQPAALAHSPEFHVQPKEEEPPAVPSTDEAPALTDGTATPDGVTAVETVPTTDTLPEASPLLNITVGMGELLFGLMVVFPWLLIVLKNQLHRRPVRRKFHERQPNS